jgi:hypothetical protein
MFYKPRTLRTNNSLRNAGVMKVEEIFSLVLELVIAVRALGSVFHHMS